MYFITHNLGRGEAIREIALLGSAVGALLVGTSVYILDRDWTATQFLAPIAAWQPDNIALFGSLGYTLPSFCHAFAFALLLILVLGRSTFARPLGAVSWFLVAVALEFLQLPRIYDPSPESTGLLAGYPFIYNFQSYAVLGHFDPGDLLAAGLGCLTAYAVASISEIRT